MNVFARLFKFVGSLAKRAFGYAQEAGLTDDLVALARQLVQEAASQVSDNAARREWVVAGLMAAGVKESLARLLVELAVQLWKKDGAPGIVVPPDPQ